MYIYTRSFDRACACVLYMLLLLYVYIYVYAREYTTRGDIITGGSRAPALKSRMFNRFTFHFNGRRRRRRRGYTCRPRSRIDGRAGSTALANCFTLEISFFWRERELLRIVSRLGAVLFFRLWTRDVVFLYIYIRSALL